MSKRILHVVTNVGHYNDPDHLTGLWLSELTHAWEVFEEQGYEQDIISPAGGKSPLEPKSLKFPNADKTAKNWQADATKMALLADTKSPDESILPSMTPSTSPVATESCSISLTTKA